MDCFNREIVGYRISRRQNTAVAEGALEDALFSRYGRDSARAQGLILRSDSGLIFSSKAFLRLMNKYGMTLECITPYTPEQKGMVERFMRTIKTECLWLSQENHRGLDRLLQQRKTALGTGLYGTGSIQE